MWWHGSTKMKSGEEETIDSLGQTNSRGCGSENMPVSASLKTALSRQHPEYMLLKPSGSDGKKSLHGSAVCLDQEYPELAGQVLDINGKKRLTADPDRYKQHGFHFNADNCIACHACESACSEKNGLPSHLAFRTVGTIEGGSYPDVTRINISMACNHCEDPVCLKGCPTRAYTKYLEYGAVLQDPDICFGCGYCTWVCPYNAPQLNPVEGQVEKCNMCVDRLEVGLKPACVTACLGNALEFGVIEDIPSGRQEAKLEIPGFPDPEISRPNIRFQQTRALPDDFRHVDADPIRYKRDQNGSKGFSVKPLDKAKKAHWGLNQLRSREDPLVFFTLATQLVVGAFLLIFISPFLSDTLGGVLTVEQHPVAMAVGLLGLVVLQTSALVSSTLHLGKPQYFYRALYNFRHSWVSREIAAVGAFYNLFFAYALVTVFPMITSWLPEAYPEILTQVLGFGATIMGPVGLYCMYRCYRINARPFWDHWHSGGAFFSSALILGSLSIGLIFGIAEFILGNSPARTLSTMAFPLLVGMLLQGGALLSHQHDMTARGEEAAVSLGLMVGKYGKTYFARWISWAILVVVALIYAGFGLEGGLSLSIWGGISSLALVHEVIGRALFYIMVVPTTTPGGIFWKNQSFQTQALQSGLADFPQVGVIKDHG